ncbi:hypothetical protein DENIS_1057 [Desulfonema ishimotonii]|uniref:Uncharacterized protein n=1 Tax=Desulfonema ishimotonii TaxID=45657 RepID=A0A401FT16_9BACT|nr:hypothetical protein [Desulfonema ishimotonii]GBC60112.1 hypothetical protein DENIS_1057 [Desulfonema ishimotonii]
MLTAFKGIINPDVVLNIATGDKELTLKEEGTDSTIRKLHIQDVPENAFAFTLDYQPGKRKNRWFKQLSCYVDVDNKEGVNKGCDLVLLFPKPGENRWIVLIFDLKSKKPVIKKTEKQLLNSELYVRYLMTMAEHHYGVDANSVEYKRAIVTTKAKLSKNPTYPKDKKTSESSDQRNPVSESFHIKAVRVRRKEAHVHLGALLK